MSRRQPPGVRMDVATLLGLAAGAGLVILGQAIEGGSLRSILQPTAALIVFGGTLGAVMVSFTAAELKAAARSARGIVTQDSATLEAAVATMVRYAAVARKNGIMGLEDQLPYEKDAFLRRGLGFAVDGAATRAVREMLELEHATREEQDLLPSRVFEAAGGYAPTLGILGAVLGLIQVMEHLSDPQGLGSGIAVAFVATVYGVGSANLVFLPAAAKLAARARQAAHRRELYIEGILSIQEGLNLRLLEEKLRGIAGLPPAVRDGARSRAA